MRKNYKSDFDFILHLLDAEGNDIGFPTYDWIAKLYASNNPQQTYVASCIGGDMVNCINDNGSIRIVCDNHGLSTGQLVVEFFANPQNGLYPDDHQLTVTPQSVDIFLVSGAGDTPTSVEVEANIPAIYVNAYELAVRGGYTGTFEEYVQATNELPTAIEELDGVIATANSAYAKTLKSLQSMAIAMAESRDATARANMAITTALEAASNANQEATRSDAATNAAIQATSEATNAATLANSATNAANQAASSAQTATANANSATSAARTATTNANQATNRLNTALNNVESATSDANTATAKATTATSKANTATSNAEAATQAARSATTAANNAIVDTQNAISDAETATANANQAKEAAENATTSALNAASEAATATTATINATADAIQATENAYLAASQITDVRDTANSALEGVDVLERDLAQYSEETPITLYTAQAGKYVDLGGNIQSASGWAISGRVRLKKGYTYLYKPSNNQPIAQGVALVSRITTETTSVLIDYTYTYDSQGRIATATADYNGAVYTYTYNEDDVPTITDSSANEVPSLPMVRVVEANERVAMFKSLSDAMPKSGYYAILCNEDCEAEVSAPAPLGELRVVSYGFIRSIVNQKEDKAVVKQLQEKVEALDTTVNHGYPRSFYEALAVDCIGKCRVYVLCRAGGAVTLRLEPISGSTPKFITKKASKHHDTILCFDVPTLNKLPDFQHPYGIFSQYGVGAYGTNSTDLLEVMALWVGGGMTNAHYLLQGAATSNLVVDHWDTEDVTDICRIFSYGLRSPILDLTALTFKPNVQVSGANDQPAAMRNMHGVEVVYLPDDFAVNSPLKAGLFAECTDLKDFSMVENMNLSGTTDVRKLVAGCTKLERIDLSRWDTSTLQLLNSLFEGCTKLKEITFGWTDTERFVNIGSLISNTAVEEIDMAWDVPNCTSAVPNLPSTIRRANMRGLKTSKMTIPNYFASGCSRLTDIDVTDWDTSNRVGFYTMFYSCKSLESLDLSSWSNENVTTYFNWIRGSGLKFITVSQKFFLGKLAIDYNLSTLGFADSAKTTSNGWLEHIASTAPTIRSKEGYGTDPDIPLLEEENGEWYINDGIGRSLQLASNLKSKSWAAQYIAQLNAKGYTIS